MNFRRIGISVTLSVFLVFISIMPALAGSSYRVKPGDSLYKIARLFGTTIQQLQSANKMGKRTWIYPGQTLTISKTSGVVRPSVSRGASARGVIPYRAGEIELLARLVTAEAGGESYQAQVAVGAVIINRVQSPIFPNNITNVIYQVEDGHYQFTPVLNGWINKPATTQALKAAREALAGSDPTKGALYFFVTGTPNRFLQAKPVSTVINNITFAF